MTSGHLLFVRAGTLFAVRFDLDRLALAGDPFPMAEQVIVNNGIGMAALSASAAGPIIYCAGTTGRQQLVWFDRSGVVVEAVGGPDAWLLSPALSPDGEQIVGGRNCRWTQSWQHLGSLADRHHARCGQTAHSGLRAGGECGLVARWQPHRVPLGGEGPRHAVCRRSRRELFYVAIDGQLMAVPVQLTSSGSTLDTGRPAPLFEAPFAALSSLRTQYAVSPDRQRFLMTTGPEDDVPPPLPSC